MANNPLTLFVDPAWKRNGLHSPLMQQWWGNPWGKSSLFAMQMFDSYPYDPTAYAVTNSMKQAHMVFAPYRHNWLLQNDPALLAECAATAKRHNIPLLIDGVGDVEIPLEIAGATILRIGGYRFIEEKGRISVPVAADDLLERCRGGALSIRDKDAGTPVVGFAGWASLTRLQALRNAVKELPLKARGVFDNRYYAMRKGVFWRARALDILARSNLVSLHAKPRATFSGSTKTAEKDLKTLREEFVEVVEACDYALEVKGDANASTRLFEILSLGRIPVVIDTERLFPFEEEVNYREFCLFVDFRNIEQLPEIVSVFHREVTQENFREMQRKAREVFVRYFRTDAQMRHIAKRLLRTL